MYKADPVYQCLDKEVGRWEAEYEKLGVFIGLIIEGARLPAGDGSEGVNPLKYQVKIRINTFPRCAPGDNAHNMPRKAVDLALSFFPASTDFRIGMLVLE